MIESEFVQVAVEAPLANLLTYRLPKNMAQEIRLGSRVRVPLGKRSSFGVVVGETAHTSAAEIAKLDVKKIKEVTELSVDPALGEKTLKWLKWLAQYYLHPPGQVYSLAFAPAGEKRKRKSKKISSTEFHDGSEDSAPPT